MFGIQNQPIGVNTLGGFIKKMASNAGLTGKKTNHSAQKTMVTRLIQNEVHPLHIAQLSGHKNLKSLDSYSVASVDQQKAMSSIISSNRNQPTSTANRTGLVDVTNRVSHFCKKVAKSSEVGHSEHNHQALQVCSQQSSSVTTLVPASASSTSIHVSANNTVNIYCGNSDDQKKRKRRIAWIDSDDDD